MCRNSLHGLRLRVAAKIADRGPEWRAFDDEQRSKRTRVGAPLTYLIHDKGLSTTIDWHDRDIYGKSLSPGQKAQVYRLRKWQRRIKARMQRSATWRLLCLR